MPHRLRWMALAAVLSLLLAGLALAHSAPASAQTDPCVPVPGHPCDPPPGPGPGGELVCGISPESGPAGTHVFVGVEGVPAGTAIQILFNGTTVAQGIATDDGFGEGALGTAGDEAALALAPRHGRAAARPSFAGALFSFTVPNIAAGTYELRAIGAGFNVVCGSFTLEAGGGATRSGGGRGLGRTGVEIAGLLALALACLVVGRALVEASRQRRRRHQRLAPPPAPVPEPESELASR